MSLTKTQEQIEKEIADILPHGLREGIARGTAIYPKIVDAYFNPFDERKSPYFQTLHIQSVIDALDPATGDALWAKVNDLREESASRRTATLDADHELGQLSKEFAEVIIAKCEGKALGQQLKEIADAKRQLERYEQSVFETMHAANPKQERVN